MTFSNHSEDHLGKISKYMAISYDGQTLSEDSPSVKHIKNVYRRACEILKWVTEKKKHVREQLQAKMYEQRIE